MGYDISIIIPVYNSELYLAGTLGNVLNQTKDNIQVILVNDASTDDSIRIMNDAHSEFGDRVVIIDLPQNSGPGVARNKALDIAEGEYIGFVDSDDIVDVTMYEKLYNVAKAESADIADCAYFRDSTKKALLHFSKECCGKLDDKKRSDLISCGGYNCMKIFKKSLLDENNIRFRPVYILEDTDFLIKAIIYAKKVAAVDEVLYRYLDGGEDSLSGEKGFYKYIESQLSAIQAVYDVAKAAECYPGIQDAIECIILSMYVNILAMIADSGEDVPEMFCKEVFALAKELKNQTVKNSIKNNRFVKIKLDEDDLKLINLADTREDFFLKKGKQKEYFYEKDIPLEKYLDCIDFHKKKTRKSFKTAGEIIWENITAEYPSGTGDFISKELKRKLCNLADSMSELSNEIRTNWDRISDPVEFLTLFQEAAISLGEQIEEQLGENLITTYMERLCECIYNLGLDNSDIISLTDDIDSIINNAKDELNNLREKYTCFFLPYQYSMWDSMESIWDVASVDSDWDVFIMPIPYFERNPDGSVGEAHYDGMEYVDKYTIKAFNEVDLAEIHPDVIFFHNPYDKYNFVTMVHPDYFSDVLKSNTDTLVYVPYYMPVGDWVGDEIIKMPGTVYANKLMLKNEKIRQRYIDVFREWTVELGNPELSKDCEKKFIVTGSPKMDRLLLTEESEIEAPPEWKGKLPADKKIILMDTHLSELMKGCEDKIIHKLKKIFGIFKFREDFFLIWRPHPLSIETIKSMHPEILEDFIELQKEIEDSDWGLLDTTKDMLPSIILSDAFYGAGSSVFELYRNINRPILIYDVNL